MAISTTSQTQKRTRKTRAVSAASTHEHSPPILPFDRPTLLLCLGLIVLVCAFYSPVLRNAFIAYDDVQYIVDNPHVDGGLTWDGVQWAFSTFEQGNWHPLTWLSHALDCELFGLNPAAHHAESVVLHGINAALLFLLLLSSTGLRWRSLMVAALFAFHPINVESVAWAAERKNVLSTLFFLLAFQAYVWYIREPSVRRYAPLFCLYALALMAKPQVITFPFLLLLWDYWPLQRVQLRPQPGSSGPNKPIASLVVEKLPLLALSAISAVVTIEAQQAGGAMRDMADYGLLLRVENAVIAYARYIGKLFWPTKLVGMYPHPTQLFPMWQVSAAALVLVGISILVILARQHRYLAVGWLWFLGSLFPVIGLVQVGEQAMADRYAYTSFIGLFLMIVWSVGDLCERPGIAAAGTSGRIGSRWLAIPAVCWMLALGILTARQVPYWHDTESFWRRTLALTENNEIAHKNLANLLHDQGNDPEALEHLRAALAIRPQDVIANMVVGEDEAARGHWQAATEHYRMVALGTGAVELRAHAYDLMGGLYRAVGDLVRARQSYESSLELSPHQPDVMLELGAVAQNSGDLPEAIRQYTRASAEQPTDIAYVLLAHALHLQGRDNDAQTMMQRAAQLSSNMEESQKQAAAMLGGR